MILSFDELIVSLFVSSARVRPVPVQMWSNLRGDFDPTIAAIASLCFLFALLVLAADLALRRRPQPADRLMTSSRSSNSPACASATARWSRSTLSTSPCAPASS